MLPGVAQFFSMKPKASPTPPPRPYDAEVEWLESTGTQWIDTGITAAINLLVEFSFAIVEYETDPSTGTNYIFGDLNATRNGFYFSPSTVTNKYSCCVMSTPNATYDEGVTVQIDTAWHYVMADSTRSAGSVRLDGIYLKSNVASTEAHNTPHTFYLFALHNSSGDVTIGAASRRRISSFKVTDTTTNQVIQDLIPVRKDGVGYMYDKVTGTLLANQGTGAFLYGKDKNPLYAAEVDYIETDGIASYIDTLVHSSETLNIQMRFSLVSFPQEVTSTAVRSLCGARAAAGFASGKCYALCVDNKSNENNIIFRAYSPNASVESSPQVDFLIHDVSLSKTTYTFDGVPYVVDGYISNTTNTFCIGKDGSMDSKTQQEKQYANARFYALKIFDNGTLVFDGVPIRIIRNGKFVGAMYDRVTNTVLENAGTGDLLVGRDKEYDYEVAYIERDGTIEWSTSGSFTGFNLTQYIHGDSLATFSCPIELVWSFSAVTSDIARGLYFGVNAFAHVSFWKYNGADVYKFGIPTSGATSVSGDLDTFHKQSVVPDGSGHYDCYMDNTFFTTVTQTSTTVIAYMLLCNVSASGFAGKVRVSSFKVGSDVYLIPVVKGNAVGFYNMVDGHLFLEEQACLSAGPVV